MSPRHNFHRLIFAGYLVITITYGIVNPIFEAPDEIWHYFTAQYIADNGRLPIVEQEYDPWMSQEAAQPPLYYAMGAALIRTVETGNPREQVWRNPFFPQGIGNADALSNRNAVIHTGAERWPWRGYVLAVHLLRLLSTLFGLGTLLCLNAAGRLLLPDNPRPTLIALGLVAFLPQFNFQNAAVSNDSLITFLASLVIWQLLKLWHTKAQRPHFPLLIGIGVTTGLAALTKNTGLLLGFFVAAVLVWTAVRKRQVRQMPVILATVGLPILLLSGWLWWRNWSLYGDLTAANQFIRVAGGDRHYSPLQVLNETSGLWDSFFAVFGWFNLRAPDWVFLVWNLLVFSGLAGLLWKIRLISWKNLVNGPALWLAGWPIIVYAGLFQFMLKTPAAQGRLLFPALVPLGLALAYGLTPEQGGKTRFSWVDWLWPGLALITTLAALFTAIPPAYAPPETLTTLPDFATPLDEDMGQGLKLVGIQIETGTAVPGDPLWITLYWKNIAGSTDPSVLVIELFGRENDLLGKLQTYPGLGLYPTNLWPHDLIIADREAFYIQKSATAPVLARAKIELAGNESHPYWLEGVKVVPLFWPEKAGQPLAELGDVASLSSVSLIQEKARPGDVISISVQWVAKEAGNQDYTTLIHLGAAEAPPLATGDSPPISGAYPTRAWVKGEVINDVYRLKIPSDLENGRYPVWIGMYDSAILSRVQLISTDSSRQNGDIFLVGWVEIEN